MNEAQAVAHVEKLKVFLSYARPDKAVAGKLARALETAGAAVWWDDHIDGGQTFAREIETALHDADAVIVCWSKTSAQSDWVRDEAMRGVEKGCLVPLSLDGTSPPLGFRQYHVLDFSTWNGRVDSEIFARLQRAVTALAGHRDIPEAKTRTLPSRRQLMIAAGTVAGVAAVGGAGWSALRQRTPAGNHDSIAILPFENMSGDPSQDYFSLGLAEEVRLTLARNPRLKVMGQVSTDDARKAGASISGVGQKLGVAYLLSGSVRRAGDIVRIGAEIADGTTGYTRWSQSFDRKLTDIFAVQSEIASTVLDALTKSLGASTDIAGGPGVQTIGTTNSQAYDAYLRGRALYNRDDGEASDREALAQFETAIRSDGKFAAARAGRARTLMNIANAYAKPDAIAGLFRAAEKDARAAVDLSPDLPDAQSTLGSVLLYGQLDAKAARPPIEKAMALGGNESGVLTRYALLSCYTQRFDDAEKAIDRAISVDPLNPLVHRTAGVVALYSRNFRDTAARIGRGLALEPHLGAAHFVTALAYIGLGQYAQARDELKMEADETSRLTGLAVVEHRLGDGGAAQSAFADLVAKYGDSALYQQAEVLAQWGRVDEAMVRLGRAYDARDSGLLALACDGLLDPVRSQRDYPALASRLGLV